MLETYTQIALRGKGTHMEITKELEEFLTQHAKTDTNFCRKELLDALYRDIGDELQPILAKNLVTLTRTPMRLDIPGFGVECVDALYLDFPIRNRSQRIKVIPRTSDEHLWVTLSATYGDLVLFYNRDRKGWDTDRESPTPFGLQDLLTWVKNQLLPGW